MWPLYRGCVYQCTPTCGPTADQNDEDLHVPRCPFDHSNDLAPTTVQQISGQSGPAGRSQAAKKVLASI